MKTKSLTYITYQTFPAETANSLQTISTVKYFIKNNFDVKLYFPLREKNSSDDINDLKKFYSIDEEFKFVGMKHNLPFGKIKFLEALWFHISHFLWSKKNVKNIIKTSNDNEIFFTRSDWVLYFLAKHDMDTVFECHQISKVRSWVLKKVSLNKKVKIIFLNDNLENYYEKLNLNSIVLHSGVDSILFSNFKNTIKKENQVVYVGNLLRFGKKRNLDFIIKAFSYDELKKFNLLIIGGPEKEALRLSTLIKESNLENITITGRLNREEAAKKIMESSIGILINDDENIHSTEFTSPLKYFEYLYANLNIVGVDFPAHQNLPYSDKIAFFKKDNYKDFVRCILESASKNNRENFEKISIDERVKEIIKFVQNN
tara:strand:+ start:1375 stop:2490 length:1116 start_codon:yes stop_codon:yes gene_type:complete